MPEFSFNYPLSYYNLATTTVVDISCIFIGTVPENTIFSITPSLPMELFIDPSNGTIYGTTTFSSLSPSTTYIVDASYDTAVVSTSVTISVDFLPVFSYPRSPYTLKLNSRASIKPSYLISNTLGITYTLVSFPPLTDISLNLDSTNGFIAGIPDVSGDFITYVIQANNNGITYDASLNISVQTAPTIRYPQPQYTLTQGIRVDILPIAIQNAGTVTYSLVGCLPIGLRFNSATGLISGVPTVLTTFRSNQITVSNFIGSDTTTLVLNVIRTFLSPPVEADNFSSNTFLTNPVVAMRRKAEILNYKKNSSNLTKQQYFALLANGNGPAAKRAWGTQGDAYTDPNSSTLQTSGNTIICNSNRIICAPTSSSDVPGTVMQLCYNPNISAIGYNPPNRVRTNIGFKWPEKSWQPGDNGFPRGKAGRGLFFG